jgi:hypothetical protein
MAGRYYYYYYDDQVSVDQHCVKDPGAIFQKVPQKQIITYVTYILPLL